MLAAFGALLGGPIAFADPCSLEQGDAEWLQYRTESAIAEMERALSFQRLEDERALRFQNECEGREEKSAACRELGISLEAVRSLRKERETLVRQIAQELTYYRQEYHIANLDLFRCRQMLAKAGIAAPTEPTIDFSRSQEREAHFQPPKADLPAYQPDVDLRPPNRIGDPSVRGPKRSREPGNLERIVPRRITELPENRELWELEGEHAREAIQDQLPKPPESSNELPSIDGLSALEREQLREALKINPFESVTDLPTIEELSVPESDELREALLDKPREHVVEIPLAVRREREKLEREKLREALLNKPPERITELPPELPSPEELQEMARDAPPLGPSSPNRTTELPPELPSSQELQETTMNAPRAETVAPPAAVPPAAPIPEAQGELSKMCSTTDEGSFPCEVMLTNADGSFDITASGKPTYSVLVIRPGSAIVFLTQTDRNVQLPGIFMQTESETESCWASDETGARVCIPK